MKIAFFGSSLVSAYWNGAATYYRGILKALHARGHEIVFFEPDAYDRQKHRDIEDPYYATVVVYPAQFESDIEKALGLVIGFDVIIKASGVGVFDTLLEQLIPELRGPTNATLFWDVDAPATLDRMLEDPTDPFLDALPKYDAVLTYGGGTKVVEGYLTAGARACHPIYNALDPDTHFPVAPDPKFAGDLGFLGNRLPDREARVENFFFDAATATPGKNYFIGGSGWDSRELPANVRNVGHVYTADHNAFNCTPLAVLNISRESMANYGYSPATRVFEAAGAGACLITDYWEGIPKFLEPGTEVLVARDGAEVAQHLSRLSEDQSRMIGEAARERVLSQHTYLHRVVDLEKILEGVGEPALS